MVNVIPVDIRCLADADRYIRLVGSDPGGRAVMKPKSRLLTLYITGLKPQAANILKQYALSRGGECATHHDILLLKPDRSDVLLAGSVKTIKQVKAMLKVQPFGLKKAAAQIGAVLERLESRPGLVWRSGRVLDLEQAAIMGIVNVTPDSFSDGGKRPDADSSYAHASRLIEEGADWLDVGGESSRPGAEPVPLEVELERVLPVIERLRKAGWSGPLSIDTTKSRTARRALDAGADAVNDISALRFDPDMAPLVAEAGVPVILMHMLGEPGSMQQNPVYEKNPVIEIIGFLAQRIEACIEAGIGFESLAVDPGFGFGKTLEHNLELLNRLESFKCLGRPVAVGTSRKRHIGEVLDLPVEDRLEGTAATVAVAVRHGAGIIRVHDVRAMKRVVRMTEAIVNQGL